MGLQQGVSVLALVYSSHCIFKLLQPILQVLLRPVPVGQVATHHPCHRHVVAKICALQTTTEKNFRPGI